MWITFVACVIFLSDSTAKDEGRYAPYLSSKGNSWEWLMASPSKSCSRMLLLLPVCEQMKVWGICVRCPGAPLRLLEENVYLKSLWFHLSLACISPQARPCQETAHILITFLAWTRRQMDVSLRHGAPRAQSPGSLSQLTFRFTCNHDNAIDASCHGA